MQAFTGNCGNQALMAREKHKQPKSARREYRCRETGADRPVVAMKAR